MESSQPNIENLVETDPNRNNPSSSVFSGSIASASAEPTSNDRIEMKTTTISNESANENASSTSSGKETSKTNLYQPITYHWFYCLGIDHWIPFSDFDNTRLEEAIERNESLDKISTNGSRFDVNLSERIRSPVYWEGPPEIVQRCSWFYKNDFNNRFNPFSEQISELLEFAYRDCILSGRWNYRLDLDRNEFIVFYAPNSVYHYFDKLTSSSDNWSPTLNDSNSNHRRIFRGISSIHIESDIDEPLDCVDHLIFFVHGIGEFCDLSFRSIKDVVDDFRSISFEMVRTHYGSQKGRVEVLPVSWHRALHTKTLDNKLREITLPSISRLRSFTNDTILDALFYTSPNYSTSLINFVADEINRLYSIFLQRNSNFRGQIALAGHSLGSLILFDLLCKQKISENQTRTDTETESTTIHQINFKPKCLFALGSPLAAFLTIRNINLDLNFKLPTCEGFFNIFHPYDPVAYRIEPMIDKSFADLKPELIPHHKGRKRIHLELKDSFQKVGTDLKQKLVSSLKIAMDSFYGLARTYLVEQESSMQSNSLYSTESKPDSATDLNREIQNEPIESCDVQSMPNLGLLNRGRRLDYVLQERPIEIFNEYVFAIASHSCYWLSEDTCLLMLKELYDDSKIIDTGQS
ncbi:Phospholipase DDHD2 [Sarcoptes scabiei]|uniref:Phospholipase DDHD2 n=1 Tax=Sarcoptes scabiei TaxID=52283 RepID=A0A834RH09_SARSC|nr:Phospholipase DDHD2 [Sarcoptes scabiei]